MHRVLVVGAGATGSAAALRLRQLGGKNVMVEVWEKARGPGANRPTFYKLNRSLHMMEHKHHPTAAGVTI